MFVIKKVKYTASWTYGIDNLNREETLGSFYEKGLQESNETEFRVEKVIKRRDYKLYAKWKRYNNFFKQLDC